MSVASEATRRIKCANRIRQIRNVRVDNKSSHRQSWEVCQGTRLTHPYRKIRVALAQKNSKDRIVRLRTQHVQGAVVGGERGIIRHGGKGWVGCTYDFHVSFSSLYEL